MLLIAAAITTAAAVCLGFLALTSGVGATRRTVRARAMGQSTSQTHAGITIALPKIETMSERNQRVKQQIEQAGLSLTLTEYAAIRVAVALVVDDKNRHCEHVRIALGAVSPTPMRARNAEAIVLHQALTEDLAEKAGVEAAKESKPISDVRSSADYRREMVRAMTKRALLNAASGKPPVTWAERRERRY